MSTFAIAGLQLELSATNNMETILREIRATKTRFPFVQLITMGELCLFGPNPEFAVELPGEEEARFCEIAKELGIWLLPGSLFERSGDKTYNTTPVINPQGEVIKRYRKMFPFYPYEAGVTPGKEFVHFDIPEVGRFGVSICYDMWFPETIRTLACQGAEVILHSTMTNTVDRNIELSIARTNAAVNQCYMVDINVAGDIGWGESIIAGPGGEVIHQASSTREIMVVELDLDYVRRVRKNGWHGLTQPLKSFRDNQVHFPQYEKGASLDNTLDYLGELKKPSI